MMHSVALDMCTPLHGRVFTVLIMYYTFPLYLSQVLLDFNEICITASTMH